MPGRTSPLQLFFSFLLWSAVSRVGGSAADYNLAKHELEHEGEWAIQFARTGEPFEDQARRLAGDMDLEILGQVGNLDAVYLFRDRTWHKSARTKRTLSDRNEHLGMHELARRVYPQYVLRRFKRVLRDASGRGQNIESSHWWKNHGETQAAFKSEHNEVAWQRKKPASTGDANWPSSNVTVWPMAFNDPMYYQQWYLGPGTNATLNIQPVWAMNITGNGVVVSVLDDGIEHTHPELVRSYDAKASLDLNSRDKDPTPDTSKDINSHGTRCAGEIAAEANNSICTVGIAYNAKVGGVRMLDGYVTDADEAAAFSLAPQHVDIYSASWGPDDDGGTVEGPGPLAQEALLQGITRGRGGKGNIYVFAGGNGGTSDDCNCDGYVNSPYTIAIGAVLKDESLPWFAELCAAQLACAFGADVTSGPGIPTTDFRNGCTDQHGGTSAAAPQAAAIFALALEANPNLSWRDLQYIVVATSRPISLFDTTWFTNGVGRLVSNKFGYGMLDAEAIVKTALGWKTLDPQIMHTVQAPMPAIGLIVDEFDGLTRSVTVEADDTKMRYVEQVQVFINLTSYYRGEISISLRSPMGTRTVLLSPRPFDESKSPFSDWGFTTVQLFGENAVGTWTLEVSDTNQNDRTGTLQGWRLLLRGTSRLCTHPLCKPVPRNITLAQTAAAQSALDDIINSTLSQFTFVPLETALPLGAESPTSQQQVSGPTESSASLISPPYCFDALLLAAVSVLLMK